MMFGPHKKDLTPLSRHGAIHKVAGKGHAPFKPTHAPGNYLKTSPAMQAPMAAHANPMPPAPPTMGASVPPPPMAGPSMAPPPPAPMMNPAQDDTGGQGPSGGI